MSDLKLSDVQEISWDEWLEVYKPVVNHLRTDGSLPEDTMFETYGDELEFVRQHTAQRLIWTLVDVEDEFIDGEWRAQSIVCPGYDIVNRVAYFITEIPWPNVDIQVNWND